MFVANSLDAFYHSATLVTIGELGDKTQLLAMMLAAKYRKPILIIAGILIATIFNHALAVWLGQTIGSVSSSGWMNWTISFLFIGIGLWMLRPDKMDDVEPKRDYGALLTTIVAFFLAEMGDKTQVATIALAAEYKHFMPVLLGTTTGMLIADVPCVFFGHKIIDKIPMKLVHYIAAAMFIWFGISRIITINF